MFARIESNTVTGVYTRTKIGTDVWEMEITGTKIGGAYSQTITGSEDYTLVDDGNLATGHYERTIDGVGSYDRTTTGAGSTLPTDADDYAYTWEQTGDPTSGYFTLDQSGTVRYDLLEDFFDISNTSAGQSPGHMNIYSFGQTFVDPDPRQAGPLPLGRERPLIPDHFPGPGGHDPRLATPPSLPRLPLDRAPGARPLGDPLPAFPLLPPNQHGQIGGRAPWQIEEDRRREAYWQWTAAQFYIMRNAPFIPAAGAGFGPGDGYSGSRWGQLPIPLPPPGAVPGARR